MPCPPDWTQKFRECKDALEKNGEDLDWDQSFRKVFVCTETAGSWDYFLRWSKEPGSWGFRGQREASWLPNTSLDRKLRESGQLHLRDDEELKFLFKFQQQAHLYFGSLPAKDDRASWLALMQHGHVPTRLLDFTSSPFVAMYFAVENEPQDDPPKAKCDCGCGKSASWEQGAMVLDEDLGEQERGRSAVWAIDLDWLATQDAQQPRASEAAAPDDPQSRAEYVNRLVRQTTKDMNLPEAAKIIRIDPARIDERMVAQQPSRYSSTRGGSTATSKSQSR
jgi:hypothetical protein